MDVHRRQELRNSLLVPVLAIISGLLVASLLILFTGVPPLTAYATMFRAGFGCEELSRCALLTTLERSTPLILTGLSAVIAFRSGMFSIGQEGQMMIGALVAAWLGYAITLPSILHQIVIIIMGMIAAGIYGWIPGMLKVKLHVNEIISTIVLNDIAILFLVYMVNFPLRADRGTTAYSPPILESAKLLTFFRGSKFGIAFIIAIMTALVIYLYLWRSIPGYEQRMAGQSRLFAIFGGVRSDRAAMRAMFLSGAVAGMAGVIEVLGIHFRINQDFAVGLGFDGLAVAILGLVHPLGVVIVSVLFAGIRIGAQLGLQFSYGIPRELGGSIIALIFLFVAAGKFYRDNIEAVSAYVDRLRGRKTAVEAAVEEQG